MFTETLLGDTKETLAVLGRSGLLDEAYLAGGSACALQLGHRISIDLDFFTPNEFDSKLLIKELKKLSRFDVDKESFRRVLSISSMQRQVKCPKCSSPVNGTM